MKYLDMFIEDCKYYDLENMELKLILKNVDLKDKTLLDVGTGIGRLAFPLTKYAKKVIALDSDERLEEYFKKRICKNLKFVNQKAEDYLKGNKKFDAILFAWPTFNINSLNLIKNAMYKKSKFVFITCDNNSDFETIVDKLGVVKKGKFDKDISNKKKFLNELPKRFKLTIKKRVKTKYRFPNEKTAFRVIKNGIKMWFGITLNEKSEKRLKDIISNHNQKEGIIFKEKIHFYVMNLK